MAARWSLRSCAWLHGVVGALYALAGDAAPPVESRSPAAEPVRFVDEDGDASNITAADGKLLWCASQPDFGCRSLQKVQLDLAGPCRLRLSFTVPWSRADGGYAVVAQPHPGPEQQHLAQQLVALARVEGAEVQGTAVDELEEGTIATSPLPLYARQPLPDLHVPPELPVAEGPSQETAPIFLRLPGAWGRVNTTTVQVTIVERPEDCRACAFSAGGDCAAQLSPAQASPLEFLDFEVPRCNFALAPGASMSAMPNHTVCVSGIGNAKDVFPGVELAAGSEEGDVTNSSGKFLAAVGRLVYRPAPRVRFMDGNLRIGVRTFLNPGWKAEIALPCENCTRLSRLAVRALVWDPHCKGMAQQTLAAVAAAARDGQMPAGVDMANAKNSKVDEIVNHRGVGVSGLPCALPPTSPCSGHVHGAFSFGTPQFDPAGGSEATFALEGSRRLMWRERQALFHHRSALCFYPTEGDPEGWLVGFVAVHMDGGDLQSFIGFVCFFGVALPLICLVTALLHYNKYERCKHHVSDLRLQFQREQLERELATRRSRTNERLTPVAAAAMGSGGQGGSSQQLPEGYWPLAGHAGTGSQAHGASSSSSSTNGAGAGGAASAWRHEVIL